jgi:hypothetical protein
MTNAPLLNKVMFYVGSLECDFKSPTVTERILNTALVLSDFRRQQSILMLTDDAEFLHWIQQRELRLSRQRVKQRELRLSRQRVKQNSLHSKAEVKTKNTVTDKLTSDHFSGVCDWLRTLQYGLNEFTSDRFYGVCGWVTALMCGREKGPHQSTAHGI